MFFPKRNALQNLECFINNNNFWAIDKYLSKILSCIRFDVENISRLLQSKQAMWSEIVKAWKDLDTRRYILSEPALRFKISYPVSWLFVSKVITPKSERLVYDRLYRYYNYELIKNARMISHWFYYKFINSFV